MRPGRLWPALLLAAAACSADTGQEQEAAGPTSADSVLLAEAEYDPAVFDTIQWPSDSEAIVRGSVVFSVSCSKCHGIDGYGDAEWVTRGDTLRPPSFHPEDWAYAEDPEGLRRLIYAGQEGGMPHWGLVGLKYRDVDAVTRFILGSLRPNR